MNYNFDENNSYGYDELKITMTSEERAYDLGEIINYTITIKNKSRGRVYDVNLSDCLAPELQFINGSVIIDNISTPLLNIITGIEFECIEPGEYIKVGFKALLLTIPEDGTITTQSNVSYNVVYDPRSHKVCKSTSSNTNTINIEIASIEIDRKVDKNKVLLNDDVTYTIIITNTGTTIAENIVLMEKMQDGLEYVENSFAMNGTYISGIDKIEKMNIGSLKPGEEIKISYSAKVIRACNSCLAINEAVATYSYKVSSCDPGKIKSTDPKKITIQISSPTFKQVDLDGNLCIPYPKPEIKEVNDIKVSIEVLDYYLIKTTQGVSLENKTLTGAELIIISKVTYVVNYIAEDEDDSSFSSYFERKFSTSIVLPERVKNTSSIRIIPAVVEDIYYRKINKRELYASINLFLSASLAF